MTPEYIMPKGIDMESVLHSMYQAGVIESWVSFVDGSVTYYRVYGNGRQIIIGQESGEVFTPIGQEVVE